MLNRRVHREVAALRLAQMAAPARHNHITDFAGLFGLTLLTILVSSSLAVGSKVTSNCTRLVIELFFYIHFVYDGP